MAITRSMTRNKSSGASNWKRIKTLNNGGEAPWSNLNHDLLNSVMMRLGVVDFIAFRGVCKSWRSLALCNRNKFMASRTPMRMFISVDANEKECYLMDLEGRKFKTILPHSAGRICVGLSCGYLILFGGETHDFWLVNPITRHELHFSDVPFDVSPAQKLSVRAILFFSPSISGWVFVMAEKFTDKIWFCIVGKGAWSHVSSTSFILDLYVFKGKIYTLHNELGVGHICELSITQKPKMTILETKNVLNKSFNNFLSSDGLYLIHKWRSEIRWSEVRKLDFGEMKWVYPEKKKVIGFCRSPMQHIYALNEEIWAPSVFIFKRCDVGLRLGYEKMWYFPMIV